MKKRWRKSIRWVILSLFSSLLCFLTLVNGSEAHWADLSVAEIVVGKTQTEVTLTFPTGLTDFADKNADGQLSPEEVRRHEDSLKLFLSDRILLTDGDGKKAQLTLKPLDTAAIPSTTLQTSTHSTLLLTYTWPKPVQALRIHYNLFLPGVSTASCQATILQNGQVQTFAFTPKNQEFSLSDGKAPWSGAQNFLFALLGCFVWGAMHAMSPGHGKTIVGAYLVGSRATVKHALFLSLTTTIAHTASVFALGLVTLFASHWLVPDRLYPWLSLISGLMVAAIGLNLGIGRLREILSKSKNVGERETSLAAVDLLSRKNWERKLTPQPAAVSFNLAHHHSHPHPFHSHLHRHSHDRGDHSHLPPGADGSPVTWKSLLALGISGGILPCPSALVVLLSAQAMGQVGLGLALVVAFSLGLAGVLTGIGLLLIYAGRLFDRLPKQMRAVKGLPVASAALVVLLGCGLAARSLAQIVNN